MQSGLARSKQMAICPLHPLNPAGPLQLGMSREEGKFPHRFAVFHLKFFDWQSELILMEH